MKRCWELFQPSCIILPQVRDPYNQMGGYVKRSLGFNAYIKIENPPRQRVQEVFVGDELLQHGRHYSAIAAGRKAALAMDSYLRSLP